MELEQQRQEVISTKDWVLTILITSIPILNIIMLFVWAFGGGTVKSKSNWAKAMLIWMIVAIVLASFYFATFAAIFASMSQTM